VIVRELTPDDARQSWDLAGLAFGYDTSGDPPDRGPDHGVGAFDHDGRLLGRAYGRPYSQWWVGREVSMCGVAGVAVHPDARGQGVVRRLMDALVDATAAPISVLFPTAPGIYRGLGWEVVGTLDTTLVPLTSLPRTADVRTRPLTAADLDGVHALYRSRGASGSGLLTREGPSFPDGPAALLASTDATTVVVEDGTVTGFLHYARGHGYRHGGPLRVHDLLASSPTARQALLAALGSWAAVVDGVRWRGSTAELATALPGTLPPAAESQPWMLRVLDAPASLEARGYVATGSASFAVGGQGYRLTASDGRGTVDDVPAEGLPGLAPQGLALLMAGVATRLFERGLASAPVPELEALTTGPPPEILDYF
jgi:predicted acetyltransferase